ncbi:Protein-glutamate methylesterase/protein-glutamine glutaminase 3 [Azospirillaceae bacterium]
MSKVLVVEDSALMRRQLRKMLEDAGFVVVTARNGLEALQLVVEEDPDVITLDINMPEMDGLTFLSRLMVEKPKPVVMVSSLTEKGALATFEALELGAVDIVHKPDGTVTHRLELIEREIVEKVRSAAKARISRVRGLRERLRRDRVVTTERPVHINIQACENGNAETMPIVLIGVSTGGPGTIEEILSALSADFPAPILVAQHMPAGFTNVFARRLNGVCALEVREVVEAIPIQPGQVLIGRGDSDLVVVKRREVLTATMAPANPELLWHPSVDRMVDTALKVTPAEGLIGVLLTGMGSDGARSMTEIRRGGGHTIAESEESAVVFGMPQELIRQGGAEVILPSSQIARQLTTWANRAKRNKAK